MTLIRKWGVEVWLASAPLGIEPACRSEKGVYDHQDLQAVPDVLLPGELGPEILVSNVGELGPTVWEAMWGS